MNDYEDFDFKEFVNQCYDSFNSSEENCSDIPGGFQDIPPQMFILLAEILGNTMAGRLPFNVQNALGNWLTLVGEIILTANSMQQYQQGGPGRYYNPKYKNVGNPFCPEASSATNTSANTGHESGYSGVTPTINRRRIEEDGRRIEELNERINELYSLIDDLYNQISELRNS